MVYFLKYKDEGLLKLNQIENFTNKRIKCIRSDNGGKNFSYKFLTYCAEKGIHHEFSNLYTPEQNGISEKLMEAARSMLFHAKSPFYFLADYFYGEYFFCQEYFPFSHP